MQPPKNDNQLPSSSTDILVKWAYALEASSDYKRVKKFFYDLLENPDSRLRPYFDVSMITLVLASVFLLIYEVKGSENIFIGWLEATFILIFLVEYLLRVWIASHNHQIVIEQYEHAELIGVPLKLSVVVRAMLVKKWQYISSPVAVIDLLAILPSYRPLRILRIFLLFRLFKMFRYARSTNEFSKVLLERRFEFLTLALFMGFLVFAAATAIYILESGGVNQDINTFFDAVYWAVVTIATVGYGDISPVTTEGRIVAMLLIISGIAVIAFCTSIVVAAFTDKLTELRDNRVYAELQRFKDYSIICGYGRVGKVVADLLAHDGENVLIIDNQAERVAVARKKGFLAIEGDAGDSRLLQSIENRRKASLVLCLTADDVTNVYITLTAKSIYKDIKIISRANRRETIKKLELAGANHVIAPYDVVGVIASESIGQPVAFEAIYGMLTGHKYFAIETVAFPALAGIEAFNIKEINFTQFKLILLGVITIDDGQLKSDHNAYDLKKHKFVFNPDKSFLYSSGMRLVVFGHRFSIQHFKDSLSTAKVQQGKIVL